MRTLIATLALVVLAGAAHAGNCTTNTALSAWGQNGTNGVLSNTGAEGAVDYTGVAGQIITPNNDGNGVANLHGTAVCEDNSGELLAVAAALSTPVWLEEGERFAISGGLGFSADGDTALGATAIVRIDKGLSAYAGGAFSTDDTDNAAGKLGLRAGF